MLIFQRGSTKSRSDLPSPIQHLWEDLPELGEPGTWQPVRLKDGRMTATLVCPNGHYGLLDIDQHQIAEDGTVTPSCICPIEDCAFHDWVKLAPWEAVLRGWPDAIAPEAG